VWDVKSAVQLLSKIELGGPFVCGTFGGDGQLFAAADLNHRVAVWTIGTGKEVAAVNGLARVNGLAFHPDDGLRLIATDEDRTLRVWQTGDAVIRAGSQVNNAVFGPNGQSVVAAVPKVRTWNVSTREEVTNPISTMSSGVYGRVGLSPDGRCLYAGGQLLDLATGKQSRWRVGQIIGPAFSADGKLLAVCTDSTATIYELPAMKEVRTLICPGSWSVAAAFSPDGKSVALGSGGAGRNGGFSVEIWDLTTGQLIRSFPNAYGTWDLAFSPDGRYLAAACGFQTSRGGEVKVWEVATGRVAAYLGGYADCVWKLALSPDGRRLTTASGAFSRTVKDAGEVRIWDVSSWQEVITLRGHTDTVFSVAYAPDGRRLVTGGRDGTIRIWGPGTPPD
jgi:WD40 repeat protein